MNPPRTAARYIRVSRVGERAGHESYGSPDDQRREIDRAAEYKKIDVVAEHVDEDHSGGTQERPGLEAAIAQALAGEIDAIICYDISRFSRFTEGGLRDLRRLQEAGARLIFAQVGELLDTSGACGKMIYTILLATHEAALEQHKARWRTTKARSIREGRQIGPTPVGYTRARGKHGALEPHPVEGPAITKAFRLAAREGLNAAVAHLRATIPTKTFTVRKPTTADYYARRMGRPVAVGDEITVAATWNQATVRRALASRVYLGEAFYRYSDGEELLNEKAHKPLTTLPEFTLAQTSPNGRAAPKASFPLTGHVRCATCGSKMPGSRAGGKAKVNGVARRVQKCINPNCARRPSVSSDPLEAHIRGLLVELAVERARQEPTTSEPVGAARRAQAALREAEERERDWRANKKQLEVLGEAAHTAVADTYARATADARTAYEASLRDAAAPTPDPAEVEDAGVEDLGVLMERLEVDAVVQPGRGHLEERVMLQAVPSE